MDRENLIHFVQKWCKGLLLIIKLLKSLINRLDFCDPRLKVRKKPLQSPWPSKCRRTFLFRRETTIWNCISGVVSIQTRYAFSMLFNSFKVFIHFILSLNTSIVINLYCLNVCRNGKNENSINVTLLTLRSTKNVGMMSVLEKSQVR